MLICNFILLRILINKDDLYFCPFSFLKPMPLNIHMEKQGGAKLCQSQRNLIKYTLALDSTIWSIKELGFGYAEIGSGHLL